MGLLTIDCEIGNCGMAQYNRQETDQRRHPQNSKHVDNNNVNVLNALENYSHQTVALTQSMLNMPAKNMMGVTERPQFHDWTW